ncbi:siderophore-interacting protein [Streptomyces sp. SID3343]|uniref:siderophore-interacting protein n=1 Tax=Streptomyces sp. SID3343 TaxID=2690260 RepID=UPI00136D4FB5|nr:siderophore-interacting protein [Streptomyces sp. SID3343]MYV99348.1 SIP domain-containing protein [Streptomyces sp. SID3343]
MADRPVRKPRKLIELQVHSAERVGPHLIRIVAGGDGYRHFTDNGFTDAYVKVLFPLPDVTYPEPFDMETIRAELPREVWPRTRTYSVRAHNPHTREITIDFVHHGDEGLAGPWAAQAKPGDTVRLLGPGGAYAPDPQADWHLFIGDESAYPAISASLERLPAAAKAVALLEVGSADEQPPGTVPETHPDLDLSTTWITRDGGPTLLDTLRALDFPTGRVHAFVHGEAGTVKELRRHLVDERGVDRGDISFSGYWRKGRDEDGFQADKAAEKAAEREAEQRT